MWNNDAPPFCKQTAFMMSFENALNSFVFDASLVHGAMFLKASLHGLKRQRAGWGGGGGRSPLHLQTQRLYDGFWEGPYGFCLCWQDDARSDVAQLNKDWI